MWTYDDVEQVNPPGKGQRTSILSYLLKIGAGWPSLLVETANELERLDSPWVCCFAQLPYPIVVEGGEYVVWGQSANAVIRLNFKLFTIDVDPSLQVSLREIKSAELSSYKNAPIGTQVRGFIQLWGRRVLYYDNYLDSLNSDGLKDQIINPRNSEWVVTSGLYKGKVMTSSIFEGEVADRLRPEMLFAMRRFLLNYSIVALHEVQPVSKALNYFLMSAPGRIAYGEAPVPLLPTMLRTSTTTPLKVIPKSKIERALQFGLREIDRYLHQLLAMQRLANEGEPELALIGCVAAIEWYMNSFIQIENDWQLSIVKCLKKEQFKSLPDELKQALLSIASSRNDLAHGQPPDRDKGKMHTTSTTDVRNAVKTGLELYREMNFRRIR